MMEKKLPLHAAFDERLRGDRTARAESEGLAFRLNDDGKTYAVIGIGSCTDTAVVIPEFYEGKPVTKIGQKAFARCGQITSLTLPSSITRIGKEAFRECYRLVEVTNLSGLSLDTIDRGNGYIDDYAKAVYTEAGTPSRLTTDEEGFLIYTDGEEKCLIGYVGTKTALTIPDGITEINQGAFARCAELASIVLPASVQSIGADAFYQCKSLRSITIPSSVQNIGEDAFLDTAWYNSLPDGVVYIGDMVYGYKGTMPKGAEIVIREGATEILGDAFRGCARLGSIKIPASVMRIGENAFEGCGCLCAVSFAKESALESIGAYAFSECEALTEVLIPASVVRIGENAFSDCDDLASVRFERGSRLKSIDKRAFCNCWSLTEIGIPATVTRIGPAAFACCESLTEILIPASIARLGGAVFAGCEELTVYCRAASKPSGWAKSWNEEDRLVIWDHKD